MNETLDLGVGSHAGVLAMALSRTSGPVLECGVGDYSTPLLHVMCGNRRKLLSVESDPDWLSKFLYLKSSTHRFVHIRDFYKFHIGWKRFSVAFVDNSPGESRIGLALRLRGHCDYIVAHDTEADIPPGGGNYGWAKLSGVFKHEQVFKEFRPWTTIYTDLEPLE